VSSKCVMWRYAAADGAVVLQEFAGVSEKYPLHDGEPLAAGFPADAAFHMHPDFPTNLLLQDCVLNSDMCIVVSERLKQALEALAPPLVEYLPVAIIDHKGRKLPQPFFIVHPVDPVDCIDRDASGAEMDEILDPDSIESVQQMVLDESRIPDGRSLFRLKHYWGAVVARRELADALSAGGFSGLRWLELDQYPEP
jgi:hypothetical protein